MKKENYEEKKQQQTNQRTAKSKRQEEKRKEKKKDRAAGKTTAVAGNRLCGCQAARGGNQGYGRAMPGTARGWAGRDVDHIRARGE